jgi:hypothetical protein
MEKAVDEVAALIRGSVPTGKALIMGVHLGGKEAREKYKKKKL